MQRWIAVGLWLVSTSAGAQAAGAYAKRGDEVVAQVRERFYDAKKGVEWARSHQGYGAAAKSEEDFERLTNEALADLKASHTAYYPRESQGFVALSSIFRPFLKLKEVEYVSMGVDVVERPEGFFVRHVFPGGPADTAGLKRGDRIVSVEGKPFHPVRSLKDRTGKPTQVTVERAKGARPLTVTVTPRRVDPKAEWLEVQEKSSRILERGGKRVAYQYVYSCAGSEHQEALAEYILGKGQEADALVVDLRDGWGGCNVDFLNLFNTRLPVLTSVARDGKQVVSVGSWVKPVVLLVNGGSRSGKELVAFAMKQREMAKLVGERTAGAALAGTPLRLSNGDLFYLAVMDVTIDGTRLEGVGVTPDVEVPEALPYAAGKDPQLEKALEVAAAAKPPPGPAEGLK
ncbi:S41 family peptidase [Hyalangium minutum]|uniref:Carboxyl-terminal protease n=1 Tax=Hyalangium minutum TaxID=394096 RepID=A0A085WKR5_9BACT|nr:S41 family peptidase [Hyalangium minutum]KFE68278.1 carboxyl-terminal protease [Hyalangium minutum]